jgi:hypothetical protein
MKPASAPPHSYGHRLRLAEGTSPRRSIFHCTHKTVYLIFLLNWFPVVYGGDGEYFGDNDAHLDRIYVFYHEASGDKYVHRTVLFDLEPGVIGAVTLSHRKRRRRNIC